jgi:Polysaccharide biosynthesis enzyme WcbI
MSTDNATGVLQRPGGRRIFVSSNCQTGPVVSVLRTIFPDDEFSAAGQVAWNRDRATIEKFAEQLKGNDIWIRYFDVARLAADPAIAPVIQDMCTVDIPHLNFQAFHPDLFYAFRASGEALRQHYNSGILVWAYRHGIDANAAKCLFNTATFADLGYLSGWDASVQFLKHHFDVCGLDFTRFFLHVKRIGVFMHTINHPKAETYVAFAKCIAMRMGATEQIWTWPIEINDTLADFMKWPVYPDVGRYLSVPAAYDWVEAGQHYNLDQFIDRSFRLYTDDGVQPHELQLNAPPEVRQRFERVLRNRIRGTS